MKQVEREGFMLSNEVWIGNISYNYHGQSVRYAKIALAVVHNPYKGQPDIAVMPYITNDHGEIVPLYSFEDDIQYQEYMHKATQCRLNNQPIPDDIDTYVRNMMKLKEMARKQADAYVKSKLSGPCDDASTEYTRNEWREDVVNSKEAQEILKEYLKSHTKA